MYQRRTLRTAGLFACAVAVGFAGAWFGMPGPWRMLLAAVHAPILLFYRRWVPALLVADLGLAVWRAYVASPMYFGRQFDTWMHLAMIRRVLEHGPVPPDPYYVGYSAAPVLSLIHQLHGAAVWLTGQAIEEVWVWGIPVLTALIGLVAYFFHRELLRDSVAALFATIFFVAWRYFEWPHANYPRVVALGFYMLALGLLLRSLRNESRWGCAGAGLVLGLSIATHPISGATGAMVAAAVLLGEWIFAARAGSGRALVVSALVFVAGSVVTAGPWIAYDFLALLRVDQLPRIIEDPKPGLFLGSRRLTFRSRGFEPGSRLEVSARHRAGEPGRPGLQAGK